MNNSDKSEELRIRATLHIQNQNYQAAIEDCNRLLQLTPNDSQAYWYRQIASGMGRRTRSDQKD